MLDISPGESFLNLREARELLESLPESIPASRWRHCLNKQGELKPAALGNSVDFLEIFSGCGHLTLGAARQGLQVGPSIDKRPGIGHDNAFSIDIKKASDRKLVWALVMVLCPRWIHCGFPCTFWVAIAHWTRIRDLEKMRWTVWSRYFTLHFHVSSCTIKPAVGGIRALRTHKAAWHGIWILCRT